MLKSFSPSLIFLALTLSVPMAVAQAPGPMAAPLTGYVRPGQVDIMKLLPPPPAHLLSIRNGASSTVNSSFTSHHSG
jgi:hypothetical protein